MIDLHALHAKLVPIVRAAGALILELQKKPIVSYGKGGTSADIASEQFLRRELSAILPESSFIGEEMGTDSDGSAPIYRFVIDPIDGTTNFIRNLPFFCISVALTQHDIPILGAIYAPMTDELFSAIQGMGAFCNGLPLSVSAVSSNRERLMIAVAGAVSHKEIRDLFGNCIFRQHGALALDMAYIAAGRIDLGLLFFGSWWDFAAGILLVQEAGGAVDVRTHGKHFAVAAGNKTLVSRAEVLGRRI